MATKKKTSPQSEPKDTGANDETTKDMQPSDRSRSNVSEPGKSKSDPQVEGPTHPDAGNVDGDNTLSQEEVGKDAAIARELYPDADNEVESGKKELSKEPTVDEKKVPVYTAVADTVPFRVVKN